MTEAKLKLIQGEKPKCPRCHSYNVDIGYGLACGGIGSYEMCFSCNNTFNFIPDKDENTEVSSD